MQELSSISGISLKRVKKQQFKSGDYDWHDDVSVDTIGSNGMLGDSRSSEAQIQSHQTGV